MSEVDKESKEESVLSKISKDRSRTNLLKKNEQKLIAYLVQRVPSWISSDMLTGIGFAGSILVSISFILAAYVDRKLLLLGILGFAINWYGDSLDGRLAYYRNIPRKWYGFTLDFTVDWLTNIVIGVGLFFYLQGYGQVIIFLFIMLYGWAMIIAILRYKLINKYSIDTSYLGPTEVRFIICAFLVLEVIVPGTIMYLGMVACIVLLVININDFKNLLKVADQCDIEERKKP